MDQHPRMNSLPLLFIEKAPFLGTVSSYIVISPNGSSIVTSTMETTSRSLTTTPTSTLILTTSFWVTCEISQCWQTGPSHTHKLLVCCSPMMNWEQQTSIVIFHPLSLSFDTTITPIKTFISAHWAITLVGRLLSCQYNTRNPSSPDGESTGPFCFHAHSTHFLNMPRPRSLRFLPDAVALI